MVAIFPVFIFAEAFCDISESRFRFSIGSYIINFGGI
jgi:hypothetical protein